MNVLLIYTIYHQKYKMKITEFLKYINKREKTLSDVEKIKKIQEKLFSNEEK